VVIWGTGTPRREFLYIDDMAEASVFVMERDEATIGAHTKPLQGHINIGTGSDITIHDLAEMIAQAVGFSGRIEYDPTKPDGPPRKLMDTSRLHRLGWRAITNLTDGLTHAYRSYLLAID